MNQDSALRMVRALGVVFGAAAFVVAAGLAVGTGAACGIRFADADGGPDEMTVGGEQDGGGALGCFADGGVTDQCPSLGLVCCGQVCSNTASDPHNCGGCGVQCEAPNGACRQSSCQH